MITYNEYLEFKSQGLKRAEIAEKFGIPDWKLKKLIAANGWGKVAPVIEFENVFEEFDEFSSYWAGFIAADGNVDSKNRLRIMLNYDDTAHLEKFKEFLGSTHTISSNTTTYYRSSLEFTSKSIVDGLRKNYAIVPNKTDKLEFPNLPEECLKYYVRGYFDGDGSICESFSSSNSKTSSLYATFASGAQKFIGSLQEVLLKAVGITGHLQDFADKNSYQLKYNTNDAKILLTWMYEDSLVHLDRKYNLYVKTVVNNNRKVR